MTFIKFNQVLIDKTGKVEDTGDFYIRPELVSAVHHVWDMHEVQIVGVCNLIAGNIGVSLRGEPSEIITRVEEALV